MTTLKYKDDLTFNALAIKRSHNYEAGIARAITAKESISRLRAISTCKKQNLPKGPVGGDRIQNRINDGSLSMQY